MDLIVFDLDGTLLNRDSKVSTFTHDTLARLQERDIAYTVATGRTLHAARDLLHDRGFNLPQIFKNGVVIWDPSRGDYSHRYLLEASQIDPILRAFQGVGIAPFIFTLEAGGQHAVYHPTLTTEAERRLADVIQRERGLPVLPLSALPEDAGITNVSALGVRSGIQAVTDHAHNTPELIAYMGRAIEDKELCWVDIHRSDGSKGGAVSVLRRDLGFSRVICFGDSDNDLSMFAEADESYAPENAREDIRNAATAVIGHHDEDGIARFLRERFDL